MLRWCARMVTGAFRYRIWKQTIDAADLLASSPPRYDQYRVAESALKSGACSAIRTLLLRERGLATKSKPYQRGKPIRFRANDRLLAFLDAL
jgi:hypothetical protein